MRKTESQFSFNQVRLPIINEEGGITTYRKYSHENPDKGDISEIEKKQDGTVNDNSIYSFLDSNNDRNPDNSAAPLPSVI